MTPLDTLKKLSPRAVAGLRAAGVDSLESAVAMSDEALLAVHGVAAASVARLRAWQHDPAAPEAESSAAPADQERVSRIWDLYRELVVQGTAPATAWERANAGVREFYRQQMMAEEVKGA